MAKCRIIHHADHRPIGRLGWRCSASNVCITKEETFCIDNCVGWLSSSSSFSFTRIRFTDLPIGCLIGSIRCTLAQESLFVTVALEEVIRAIALVVNESPELNGRSRVVGHEVRVGRKDRSNALNPNTLLRLETGERDFSLPNIHKTCHSIILTLPIPPEETSSRPSRR